MNKFINYIAKILTTILCGTSALLISYFLLHNENVSLIISVVVALLCYCTIENEKAAQL
jgi:uncharacterized membrane protein